MNRLEAVKSARTFSIFLTFLLVGLGIALLLMASVPPISRDALVHHLAIPKLYLQHEKIFEIPSLDFSYYPMNVDLLYLGPLYLGNDILPKLIHFLFGLATCFLLYRHLAARLPHWLAISGPLLFLSTPVIARLSTTAYVDLGLTLFSFSSIILCLRWINRDNNIGLWILFLAGCCAGLAAGTKYSGILVILILCCLLPLFTPRQPHQRQFSQLYPALVFFIGALLTFSPWLIRNSLWTGNPLFPLFQSIFNPGDAAGLYAHHSPILERKLAFNESLIETILLPVRMFFQGQDNNPQFFDGRLNPFLLFLPIAAFICRPSNPQHGRERLFLGVFSLLFILLALGQGVARVRYLAPALPCLAILSMYGLNNLTTIIRDRNWPLVRNFLPVACLLTALGLNALYLHKLWFEVDPLPYLRGTVSRDEYITQRWPEYQVVHYANQHLTQDDRILAVFLGNRGYYFDIPHEFDLRNGKSQLIALINSSTSGEEIAHQLQRQGITHLLIWHNLLDVEISRLSLQEQKIFSSFRTNNLIELFHFQQHALYRVKI